MYHVSLTEEFSTQQQVTEFADWEIITSYLQWPSKQCWAFNTTMYWIICWHQLYCTHNVFYIRLLYWHSNTQFLITIVIYNLFKWNVLSYWTVFAYIMKHIIYWGSTYSIYFSGGKAIGILETCDWGFQSKLEKI